MTLIVPKQFRPNSSMKTVSLKSKLMAYALIAGVGITTIAMGFGLGFAISPQGKIIVDSWKGFSLEGKISVVLSLSFGIPTTLVGLTSKVAAEFQKSINRAADQKVDDLVLRRNKSFTQKLGLLKSRLDSTQLPPDIAKEIDDVVFNIEKELIEFGIREKASREILEWLDSPVNNFQNARELQKLVISSALNSSEVEISDEVSQKFKHDINKCINWLRYSIKYLQPCKIECVNDYLSALLDGNLSSLSLYLEAFEALKRAMKQNNQSGNRSVKAEVIDVMINVLIEGLKSEVM